MSDRDKLFAGSIPELYDTYMVPLIFQDYADDMARRVAALHPRQVLEVAAGSGVVTRALAPQLARDAHYVATDLNQPMLDRAASRQGPDDRIEWRQADALNLPFEDRRFDVACCQFGAMFFPDRVAGYREARRVLKRGASFIFNVWDSLEHNDFARVVTEEVARIFPNNPSHFMARTPHGYFDKRMIEADVRAAGFGDVAIETVTRNSVAANPRIPALALCQGTPFRNEILARDPNALERVTDRASAALEKVFGKGPIAAKIQAHVVVAR